MANATDRHVRTRQRVPSNKAIVARIEKVLGGETNPTSRAQLERALEYWKRHSLRLPLSSEGNKDVSAQ